MTSIESLPSDDLYQKRVIQEFLAGDDGPWTTVYSSGDLGLYAGFAPLDSVPVLLEQYSWDVRIGQGGPFLEGSSRGDVRYVPSGGDHGVKPVVITQEHFGVLPRMLPQLLQEFSLFHNLWHADGMTFKKLHDDGTEEAACEVSHDLVRIRTKLLRQFQAAAQLALVRYMDSIVRAVDSDDVGAQLHFREDDHHLHLAIHKPGPPNKWTSLLIGKKVVLPPPMSECGVWPFDRQEDSVYQEFVIDETPEGEPIKSTCDPERLADYFGRNPEAPNYVTPVFFAPEVLDRYYSNPTKYEVRDGYIACGGLWGLRLDNNHPDHVMVWLGDLGRDLPESERNYWLAHNIFVPEGTISQTTFKRHIQGEAAEPDSPAWRLQQAYTRFRKAWSAEWGWDLFRDPDDDDPQILAGLRIPPRGGNAEFGKQVQALHRLLVESINSSQLKSELPKGEKGEQSIGLLKRWLEDIGHQRVEQDIAFLRKINELRNVSEHKAGAKHAKAIAKHQIDDDRRKAIAALFEEAISLLHSLRKVKAGGNV